VKIKYSPISSALFSVDKLSKINLNLNIVDEGEESLMKLELQCKTIVEAKILWEEGKITW
jgi:regulator of RNase E activity RraB